MAFWDDLQKTVSKTAESGLKQTKNAIKNPSQEVFSLEGPYFINANQSYPTEGPDIADNIYHFHSIHNHNFHTPEFVSLG